jgi:hypothetical protein
MANVIDLDQYRAETIARDFIAEHGEAEFLEFQKMIREYLSACEDLGLVPQDIIDRFGSVRGMN